MIKEGYLNFMGLSRKRRDELDEITEEFLRKYSIDMKGDIFQVLEKIGFEVHKANFRQPLEGIIFVDENEKRIKDFDKNKIIFYNANADLYKTRFILAHELAHYVNEKNKHPDRKVFFAMRDHQIGYSNNISEQEIDYMAASMLIPKEELKNNVYKHLGELNYNKDIIHNLITDQYYIEQLQKDYRVDAELIKRRLTEVFVEDGRAVL